VNGTPEAADADTSATESSEPAAATESTEPGDAPTEDTADE
jgi:hypothetical protein